MRNSPVYLPLDALAAVCRFEALRRSGPGGQNRNKVETGVRYYHVASGLVGEATERRSQGENKKAALARLRLLLALETREPVSISIGADGAPILKDASSFRWFERLSGSMIRASRESFDYAVLVAEFFDVYACASGDLRASAALLRTTPSQIVRFLSLAPRALERLNALRAAQGLGRLRSQ